MSKREKEKDLKSLVKEWMRELNGHLKKADEVNLDKERSDFILGVLGEVDMLREGLMNGYIGNIHYGDKKRIENQLWSIRTWFWNKERPVTIQEIRDFRSVVYEAKGDFEDLCDMAEKDVETMDYSDVISELDRISTCINCYKAEYPIEKFEKLKAKTKYLLPAN